MVKFSPIHITVNNDENSRRNLIMEFIEAIIKLAPIAIKAISMGIEICNDITNACEESDTSDNRADTYVYKVPYKGIPQYTSPTESTTTQPPYSFRSETVPFGELQSRIKCNNTRRDDDQYRSYKYTFKF